METAKLLRARRAIRTYTGQITPEQLTTLLAAGNAAPVGMGNYGDYRLVAIQDPDLLHQLSGNYDAPTEIIVAVHQPGRMEVLSAGVIVHNMVLCAEDLGLGANYNMASLPSLPVGVLPPGFEAVFGLTVGQTTATFTPREIPADRIPTTIIK